ASSPIARTLVRAIRAKERLARFRLALLPRQGRLAAPHWEYRRRAGEKPECNGGVENEAAERRSGHERPDRVGVEMVRQIPGGMHEPGDPDEPIRIQAEIHDRRRHHRIDQLPRTESPAAQVRTARTGDEDGVETPARRLS